MDNENKPSAAARRQFLADTARMACGVGLLGLGVGLYAKHAKALPPAAIRPPGALPETEFSAACIRCGLCVRDCPFDILHLAKPEEPMSTGTPYFVARQLPCEMCEDIPCVKACPTGALDHSLKDINKSKMGLAVLVDHETCLNFLGLRCDICYRVCPVIDKAITLDPQTNARTGKHTLFIPVVHSDHCTGCGKCEKACPTEVASIKVFPLYMAKGQLSSHYRLGWVEKEKAGGSLVAPDVEHRYNMPEGMKYESGKGFRPALPPMRPPGRGPPGSTSGSAQGFPGRQAVSATPATRPGAEAIAAKGWLAAHKWLLLRRSSQIGILLLFLVGPWFGIWIVKGNLNFSYTLNFLPLTDPYVILQSLLARQVPEKLALIGVAIVVLFYLLVGGRAIVPGSARSTC
jgi:ferredoxin-type protein NapG